ncbi:MAG: hypothetical protein A2391_02300 [Candidatus Brennerbacteria bacterium RIFOXYB1_FULL_41_13]|uniref:Adenylate kinase n=1 Tax=Candidatus Brennerbacteria bacterium RIFOXYD1_FULL_41_16 TaxID=1797529 RepID=A0A1G1XJA2_9BACT|nr:MAG: hypothetical protein A2391_02300 [Candidatus Brennerbacteria bacterium RIFOXYB1_FULL_41_13]OGY40215.1 MAG: hypothetical protein A2570_02925 [Candidatus Brennerbacteria bacterium RIFOXYD1_FULL_41_16]
MSKFHVFCIIGKSGSGKGTQVELLKKKLGKTKHIINGDLFRAFIKLDNLLSKKTKKVVNSGGLPPAWLSAYLWQTEFLKPISAGTKSAIFEGTPRRIWEADILDDVSDYLFDQRSVAIYIDISDKEAKQRLLIRLVCKKCKQPVPYKLIKLNPKKCSFCGGGIEKRKDDDEQAILKRLTWFKTDVLPTVEYYKKKGRLVHVNGEQDVPLVFKELWSKLSKRLKS